ncbi:MAG TPA: hypothetical protein VK158_04385 [Acidobacteriota bacterium]|nr:hypothetical protein [Acidobacteriota bacterium]
MKTKEKTMVFESTAHKLPSVENNIRAIFNRIQNPLKCGKKMERVFTVVHQKKEKHVAQTTHDVNHQNAQPLSKYTIQTIPTISEELKPLLSQASATYVQHFNGKTWYGRCIFLSWYCALADCSFCFRATKVRGTNQATKTPQESLRSQASVALEALFCKTFGWRIEFLTGGYGMMPFPKLVEFAKLVSTVYGEKIWLNVGILSEHQLTQLQPYVKGICSSIETCTPKLHDEVCPRKPIGPYEKMFSMMNEKFPYMKKSIAIIVGLSKETGINDDFQDLTNFIEKHKLDRITIYALKPVRGTKFTQPPTTDEFIEIIVKVRTRFPKLQIIAGTNLRRCLEAGYLMKAGANAITKFPATKQFATPLAQQVSALIGNENRTFTSNLTKMPDIDWNSTIQALDIDQEIKEEMKKKVQPYLRRFAQPTTVESESGCFEE